MLGASESEAKALMKRVRIVSAGAPAGRGQVLRAGRQRAAAAQAPAADVLHAQAHSESERIVSPQRLVHYRNTWYLDAWCHKSDGLRRFSLDAIRGGAMLEQKAKEVPIKAIEAELDGGYGIFSGARLQWATLRFTPEAAQWVRARAVASGAGDDGSKRMAR